MDVCRIMMASLYKWQPISMLFVVVCVCALILNSREKKIKTVLKVRLLHVFVEVAAPTQQQRLLMRICWLLLFILNCY